MDARGGVQEVDLHHLFLHGRLEDFNSWHMHQQTRKYFSLKTLLNDKL